MTATMKTTLALMRTLTSTTRILGQTDGCPPAWNGVRERGVGSDAWPQTQHVHRVGGPVAANCCVSYQTKRTRKPFVHLKNFSFFVFSRTTSLCRLSLPFSSHLGIHRSKKENIGMEDVCSAISFALDEKRIILEAAEHSGEALEQDAALQGSRVTLSRVCVAAEAAMGEHQRQNESSAAAALKRASQQGEEYVLRTMDYLRRRIEGSPLQSGAGDQGDVAAGSAAVEICHPHALEDAVCDALSCGRGVVAVKNASHIGNDSLQGVVGSIRAEQSNLRKQLYLGQRRNDASILVSSSHCAAGGRAKLIPAAPPLPALPTMAARQLAVLNVKAECAFLQQAIWVDTKLALLSAWEQLREELDMISRRRKVFFEKLGFRASALPSTSSTSAWFRVEYCNQGVVQLVVRRALRLSLCYLRKPKRWELRSCQWLVKASAPLGDESDPTVLATSDGGETVIEISEHQEGAVARQLQLAFAKNFVDGCLMALNAVAGLWLEVAELQLQAMKEEMKNRGAAFDIDVQPNSGFIAVRLSVAGHKNVGSIDETLRNAETQQRSVSSQTKLFVHDYSLFRQRSIGTDMMRAQLWDVLDSSPRESSGGDDTFELPAVDAKAMLLEDWLECSSVSES